MGSWDGVALSTGTAQCSQSRRGLEGHLTCCSQGLYPLQLFVFHSLILSHQFKGQMALLWPTFACPSNQTGGVPSKSEPEVEA